MACTTLAHTLKNSPVSWFGHWNAEKLTWKKVDTNFFYLRYVIKNTYLAIYSSGDAGAVILSSSESDFYMVNCLGRYMLGEILAGCTGFTFSICDKSGMASGIRDNKWLSASGWSEPTLICLHPGWDVTCIMCDCPGTISRTCISSPNVVGDGVAAVMSVWGFTTAGTFNSVIPYSISLSQKWLAASLHPGCVSALSLIRFCQSSPCGAVLLWRLCPSPSQVCHLRSACQALYLLHHRPHLPHPPHLQNLQDCSDCLR